MKKSLLALLTALLLNACATTNIPPRIVHTGIGLTRHTYLESTPKDQNEKAFSFGGSLSRGASYTDTGTLTGNNSFDINGEIKPLKGFSIGLVPYYASVDGSLDTNNHTGLEIYSRIRLINSDTNSVSFYPSVRIADNSAVSNGKTCGSGFVLFGSSCTNTSDKSVTTIDVVEPGVSMIWEHFMSPTQSFAFAPTVYHAWIKSRNTWVNQVNYDHNVRRTNYSMLVYYHYTQKEGLSLQLGVGAASLKGFADTASKMRILPVGNISLVIPLGTELK